MAKYSRVVAYSSLMGALMTLKILWGIVKTLNLFMHPMHWARKF